MGSVMINWINVAGIIVCLLVLKLIIWYLHFKYDMWVTEKEGYYWERGRQKYLDEEEYR